MVATKSRLDWGATDEVADPFVGAWCVLAVAPQREATVADRLRRLGLNHYLPCVKRTRLYAKRKVVIDVPIYPGYLFADYASVERRADLRGPWVQELLTVHESEQAGLLCQLRQLTRTLEIDPWQQTDTWTPGRLVRIVRGAYQGVTGNLIYRRGRHRLCVGVKLMGTAVELTVDIEDVESVEQG